MLAALVLLFGAARPPEAVYFLWRVSLTPQAEGESPAVTPVQLSRTVTNQAYLGIVLATTILAENMLPMTPVTPSLAAEGRPCESAQWDAASPSNRLMKTRRWQQPSGWAPSFW